MAGIINGVQEEVVWCFWFGDEMSEQRKSCLENMKIVHPNLMLVDSLNFKDFILKDHPIHDGFHLLSATHKSDYLRSYFMHHYGGGYSDIKNQSDSWKKIFKIIKENEFIGAGYREVSPHHLAINNKTISNVSDFANFIGCGAFIFEPKTDLTLEWVEETTRLIENNYEALRRRDGLYHPRATKRGAQQTNLPPSGYPFDWIDVMGHIYHPIVYKYRHKIIKNLPKPIMKGYR